jgi:MFS family permease
MLVVTSVLLTIWHAQAWEIYVIYGITGIGFGLFYAAYPILIAEAVPGEEMGTASGIVNVINSLGSGICPTVVGLILAEALLRTDSVTGAPVYTDGGYVGAWIFLTVVGVGALLVSLLMRHGGLPLGVEPEAASEIAKGTAVPR